MLTLKSFLITVMSEPLTNGFREMAECIVLSCERSFALDQRGSQPSHRIAHVARTRCDLVGGSLELRSVEDGTCAVLSIPASTEET